MCFYVKDFLLKFQSFQLSDPIFSGKKRGKIYFLEHSQQHINLSHRLTFGLPKHTIFSAADWSYKTTSLFPLLNW